MLLLRTVGWFLTTEVLEAFNEPLTKRSHRSVPSASKSSMVKLTEMFWLSLYPLIGLATVRFGAMFFTSIPKMGVVLISPEVSLNQKYQPTVLSRVKFT